GGEDDLRNLSGLLHEDVTAKYVLDMDGEPAFFDAHFPPLHHRRPSGFEERAMYTCPRTEAAASSARSRTPVHENDVPARPRTPAPPLSTHQQQLAANAGLYRSHERYLCDPAAAAAAAANK